MSHSQTQTSHGSGTVQATGAQKGSGDALRAAVAAQPTLQGSVAALLAGIAGMIDEALAKADPGALKGLADSISSDLGAWVAAVPANTPQAVLSAGMFGNVPASVQQAFDAFAQAQAQHAQTQAQHAAGGAPAAH